VQLDPKICLAQQTSTDEQGIPENHEKQCHFRKLRLLGINGIPTHAQAKKQMIGETFGPILVTDERETQEGRSS
jgi:hypothetical protein